MPCNGLRFACGSRVSQVENRLQRHERPTRQCGSHRATPADQLESYSATFLSALTRHDEVQRPRELERRPAHRQSDSPSPRLLACALPADSVASRQCLSFLIRAKAPAALAAPGHNVAHDSQLCRWLRVLNPAADAFGARHARHGCST